MSVQDAIHYAQLHHGKQMYGECPYVVHLLLVARHFTSETEIIAALLHDILEDTNASPEEIENLFGKDVRHTVQALTRLPNEHYLHDYIPRVATNQRALRIKIADLKENIHSARYMYPGKYDYLVPRYEQALLYLIGVLTPLPLH